MDVLFPTFSPIRGYFYHVTYKLVEDLLKHFIQSYSLIICKALLSHFEEIILNKLFFFGGEGWRGS